MTVDELLNEYPAGLFKKTSPTNINSAEYFDKISSSFALTPNEKALMAKHGFVVTERGSEETFTAAFLKIYNQDLPVYVSADAILHSVHYSFDNILKDIETNVLNSKLDSLINFLRSQIPVLATKSTNEYYKLAINDFDVYTSVASGLFRDDYSPVFSENQAFINQLAKAITDEQPQMIFLFSSTERNYDFSQLTVRGHYTETEILKKYFQTMMWLGRTEIYISAPKQSNPDLVQKECDLMRQAILAALIVEAIHNTNSVYILDDFEAILGAFLGSQDNIAFKDFEATMAKLNIQSAAQLTDSLLNSNFRQELLKLSSANQLYNSQILMSDPTNPDQSVPPASFLLMGQRPIIDGFITANLVYDRILYHGEKVKRMLPKPLDILFAMGNNASTQLLINELTEYPYSSNLAAERYLIEGYDSDFWNSNIYTGWWKAIRSLNPPLDRTNLPAFMQTAAWWQKSMTTQLASWAELRHDFLLYAKQPYSEGIDTCNYPYSYVEPVAELYHAISDLAVKMGGIIDKIDFGYYGGNKKRLIKDYYQYTGTTCDTLADIADKELNHQQLSGVEADFLKHMLFETTSQGGCGGPETVLNGWYYDMFYNYNPKPNYIVADVHTAPTDQDGNMVGWVLHGGTGKVNLAVIVTDRQDGTSCAYIGPVFSYYEYTSENFKRLTDEEWLEMDKANLKPDFSRLYMADSLGNSYSNFTMLLTGIDDPIIPNQNVELTCYPNPFENSTSIIFNIPQSMMNKAVELNIFDLKGEPVINLIKQEMPSGNYVSYWSGENSQGNKVQSGVYIYSLKIGDEVKTGKVSFVR
jgi:hypothetical protein